MRCAATSGSPRLSLRARSLIILFVLLSACGGGVIRRVDEPPPLPPPPRGQGIISVKVEPRDALILLDDRPLAVPLRLRRGVVFAPLGRHRIEIQRAGHLTWYGVLTIRRTRPVELQVQLLPIPPLLPQD